MEMLCTRRKRFMLNFVFKYSNDIQNVYITRPAMEFRGRHKVKMKLPHSLKERVLRSPYYLAVDVWNQPNENVQKLKLKLMDLNVIKFGIKE